MKTVQPKRRIVESLLQSRLIRLLEKHDYYVQKVVGQSRRGLPDVLAVKNGVAFFFEVKTKTGFLSNYQMMEIARLTHHNAMVIVVFGEQGLEELEQKLTDELAVQPGHFLMLGAPTTKYRLEKLGEMEKKYGIQKVQE